MAIARIGLWLIVLSVFSVSLNAKPVVLAAAPFATYVDDEGEPARLNALVTEAFRRMGQDVQLDVMRQAFLGSALLSQKADGEFASIDLGDVSDTVYYSQTYLPVYLYVASKRQDVTDMRLVPHLSDARIAIENRFANTPRFRLIKDVKWSRNPSTFDTFRQVADDRAPYLLSSRLLIDEFNRLLAADNEELLMLSGAPLVIAGIRLSVRKTLPDAGALLDSFDKTIAAMQQDGTYNKLLALNWLTKDITGDGVADYITSTALPHTSLDSAVLGFAYPLDATKPSVDAVFVVDGDILPDWEAVRQRLTAAGEPSASSPRPSLLDASVYRTMIKRW
ncbi:substrate-binding periplasmic protein [Alteromonas sp. CYL-A6]|uniref:substrate-binding periplasmic protein n=1 Tax=Alteromonas nitratireducens TaxID=3390813 RepID=UPI0034C2025C